MSDLYDTDFYQWTKQQAAALVAGKASELDWANLAEEIESLGKSDRREIRNRLRVLIRHLLKWQYQPELRQSGRSWRRTIWTQRERLSDVLDDSPSLRRQMPELIAMDYDRILEKTSDETGLPLSTFPAECPWTAEQILDDNFLP
jgi:Domain of unknown function DUF29